MRHHGASKKTVIGVERCRHHTRTQDNDGSRERILRWDWGGPSLERSPLAESRSARTECRRFAKPFSFALYMTHHRRFSKSPRVAREPLPASRGGRHNRLSPSASSPGTRNTVPNHRGSNTSGTCHASTT